MIVLEVKGGRIAVADGRWYATDRLDETHEIKNPFVQATASKHALLAFLRGVLPKPPGIGHAVVFPDAVVAEPIAMQTRNIVIDGGDLASPVTVIHRVLEHCEQLNSSPTSAPVRDRIVRRLPPTVVIRRRSPGSRRGRHFARCSRTRFRLARTSRTAPSIGTSFTRPSFTSRTRLSISAAHDLPTSCGESKGRILQAQEEVVSQRLLAELLGARVHGTRPSTASPCGEQIPADGGGCPRCRG